MHYFYILKTGDKHYVGSSADLKRRLREHKNGKVKSTKYKKPIDLIYYEAYSNKYLAQEREKSIKKFGSAYSSLIKRISK